MSGDNGEDKNGDINQESEKSNVSSDLQDQSLQLSKDDISSDNMADESIELSPKDNVSTDVLDGENLSLNQEAVKSDSEVSPTRKRKRVEETDEDAGLGQVVAKHYNELEEKGLTARANSRIYFMRNFNNWIKSMTINQVVDIFRKLQMENIKILDMCCGKGGDILKWSKTGMTDHVVFIDIAETSVQQCKERYMHLDAEARRNERNRRGRGNKTFSAEFYTADCTKVRLRSIYKDPKIKFDLVSVQFSFHYCFESLPQAQMMLKNVSENLKPGGYFIGTTTNSNRIVKKFLNHERKEYGNDIYRINVETPEPFPLFGAKYYFQLHEVVNNCPEFLVNFPSFVKLAERQGLKLVFKHTFDEYFKLKLEDGHFLLDRMHALETYPQFDGESLSSEKDEDYAHAKKFKEESPDVSRFGTLSKSEWEAVSLYVAFAFEKVG